MTTAPRPTALASIGRLTRPARAVTLAITALGVAGAAIAYPTLEPRIPIHWNAAGTADGWGPSWMLLVLLGLWLALAAGLEWLSRHPRVLNYPVEVTEDNAARLYGAAVDMLVWINLILAVLWASLVAQSYGYAVGVVTGFALVCTGAALVVGMVRMFRAA